MYKRQGVNVIDTSRNLVNIGTISSGAITSSSTITSQANSAAAGIRIRRTNSAASGARGHIAFMDSDNNFVASIDSRATGVNNSGDLNFFTSTGQSYSGVYDNPSATLTLGTDNNATFAGDVLLADSKQIKFGACLLYTSPSPRDYAASRMPSSA